MFTKPNVLVLSDSLDYSGAVHWQEEARALKRFALIAARVFSEQSRVEVLERRIKGREFSEVWVVTPTLSMDMRHLAIFATMNGLAVTNKHPEFSQNQLT